MKFQLPHTIAGLRVETVTALIALFGVPVVLSPLFVSYPVKEVCTQVQGCDVLSGSPLEWVTADDYVGFRKVLKLKVAKGADTEQVKQEVASKATELLAPYLKVFPVREPKIELMQAETANKKKKGN